MKSKIQIENGSPKLYINGKKTAPVLYGLSDIPASNSNTAQAQRNIKNFAQAGINLVTADTSLTLGWHKHDPFECEPMFAEIAGIVEAEPDAGVLLRLHLNPPYWWLRDHPEEQIIYRTPNGDIPGIDNGECPRLIRNDLEGHIRVSLASKLWLKEAGEKLRIFCEELKKNPEYENVIGIQVACGVYGEWHQWGCDCSKPMKERFHEYLREQYASDEDLQRAWNDPTVTRDNAPFNPESPRQADDGRFYDPRASRNVIDSKHCIQLVPAEDINYFSNIVKDELPDILVGAFYGYYFGIGADVTILGHLYIDKMFGSGSSIDFLCGPFPYNESRCLRDGIPMQRCVLEALRRNGILWLTEMDDRTIGITDDTSGGDPEFFDETVARLRRYFLQPVLGGMGLWFYDHRIAPINSSSQNSRTGSIWLKKGWWDTPELMDEIAKLKQLADEVSDKPYEAVADVLVVYDTEVFFTYASCPNDINEYKLQEAVSRTGAAYDNGLLSQLSRMDIQRYRVIIFANTYYVTPQMRDEILRLTAGKTLIWLYAPGYCDGETLSVDNISALTGFSICKAPRYSSYTVVDELGGETVVCENAIHDPAFVIDDADAQTFGNCNEGIAVAKKKNAWMFCFPTVTSKMLKTIFRTAGVHMYTDSGDPIIAGAGLIAMNSFEGGKRELSLRSGEKISVKLLPHTTAVFDAENGKRKL